MFSTGRGETTVRFLTLRDKNVRYPFPFDSPYFRSPKSRASEEAPRPTVETIGVACLCQLVRRDATNRQIDKLMYEIYGLSEDEIKIVEGAN